MKSLSMRINTFCALIRWISRFALLKARGAYRISTVGFRRNYEQPTRGVPGAPKSLPGVQEQLLSRRVGDTRKTSFYTRWHEMHFI